MTTKKQRQTDFVPSTGDEPYMQNSKFASGQYGEITALSLGQATQYAHAINKTIEEVQKTAAKGQLKIGNLLLKARELFKGDKEFGNWRAENTEIKSMQVASNLMAVARKFASAPKMIEACSYSALVELVSAPAALIKEIEATVEAGNLPPNSATIRADKKELALPAPVGKTSKAENYMSNRPPDDQPLDPEEEAVNLVHGDLASRLNHKDPYVKLGLYPFGGPPNPEVLEAIEHWYSCREADGSITEDQYEQLAIAISAVQKEYKK